MTKCKCKIRS